MSLSLPHFHAFTGKNNSINIKTSVSSSMPTRFCWICTWLWDGSNQQDRKTSSAHPHKNAQRATDGRAATAMGEKVTITMLQPWKDFREAQTLLKHIWCNTILKYVLIWHFTDLLFSLDTKTIRQYKKGTQVVNYSVLLNSGHNPVNHTQTINVWHCDE